jgi:uncharacterized phiE125 gp8 family phage protein
MTNWYSSWFIHRQERYSRFGLRILQEPLAEPLSVDQVALHLRLDSYGSPPEYPELELIQRTTSAARQICEEYLGRSLATYLLEIGARSFPDYEIELPMGPLQEMHSVEFEDGSGITTVLAEGVDYYVDRYAEVPCIVPNGSWPTSRGIPGSVRVRYMAGYSERTNSPSLTGLPWSLMAAMLLMIGHLYENREDTSDKPLTLIPNGARSLMNPYKVRIGMA